MIIALLNEAAAVQQDLLDFQIIKEILTHYPETLSDLRSGADQISICPAEIDILLQILERK